MLPISGVGGTQFFTRHWIKPNPLAHPHEAGWFPSPDEQQPPSDKRIQYSTLVAAAPFSAKATWR